MDLSFIQKDILITLIELYHQQSHAIKGEEIAEVLRRNPGTVRNQMQALKALGLVDGIPGPKGGYTPTASAYETLNLTTSDKEYNVPISRHGQLVKGVNVQEIDFTTLCHPDVCQAVVKLIGSVKVFEIGDEIAIGPTPVNKLFMIGEVFGKDEVQSSLLVSIQEMISLPKKPIKYYMSSPLHTLEAQSTLKDAMHLFSNHQIHGAPVVSGDQLLGIVTLTDVARGIDRNISLDSPVTMVMTADVVRMPADINLYQVIGRFKERRIGRIVVVEDGKPIGILTQSDIISVFPAL